LAALFDSMFKLENFRKSKYLVGRCTPYLELPTKTIMDEYSVKGISNDRALVVKALKQCQYITSVNDQYTKLKYATSKNKIVVKGVS